jgi:hypothetical protein
MANELIVKYVTFHSVLKELIVTYSINSKKITTNTGQKREGAKE